MYILALIVHSWLRWIVLALGIALLGVSIRAWMARTAWGARHEGLRLAFLRTLDLQFLLGLTLYLLLSPLPRAGLADLGSTMGDPILRFYTIEHAFGMFVGVAIAHFGLGRAPRLDAERRARIVAITMLAWALVTVASVPWPIAAYGRPLFRL